MISVGLAPTGWDKPKGPKPRLEPTWSDFHLTKPPPTAILIRSNGFRSDNFMGSG